MILAAAALVTAGAVILGDVAHSVWRQQAREHQLFAAPAPAAADVTYEERAA